jgi:uncharacterized LabA/DUF88 family protein
MIEKQLEKSLILIDAENVLKSWQTHTSQNKENNRIDYVKLINKLSENTNLLRAIFYDGISEAPSREKKKFLLALSKNGIQIKTKVIRKREMTCPHCKSKIDRFIQKGVDVSLASDIVRHAFQGTCNICIVVSGDEDYKDAIEIAKDKGLKIWVASFRKSLSMDLEKSADKVVWIDDIYPEIILK